MIGGSPQQLTREPGYYAASFGKSGSVYVRQAMSLTSVPKLTVHRVERSQSQLQTGPGTEVDPSAGECIVSAHRDSFPQVEPGGHLVLGGQASWRLADASSGGLTMRVLIVKPAPGEWVLHR